MKASQNVVEWLHFKVIIQVVMHCWWLGGYEDRVYQSFLGKMVPKKCDEMTKNLVWIISYVLSGHVLMSINHPLTLYNIIYSQQGADMLLNQTTAIVQVLLAKACTLPLGGAVPISSSGNRATSGWPLYATSCLGIRERWRTKSEEKLHLCTFHIWCTW